MANRNGKVISISSVKGGVGKTTTAINLSAALAEEGKKILHSSSRRIKTLSAGQQTKIGFLFLDEGKHSVYEALRQMKAKELPVVKTTIVYKNLCGAYFKVESFSTVFPSAEDTHQLIAWHTSITTATTASKEIIGRMLNMCLSIRNCIKRAPKSTVPGQHRFGF